MERRWWTLVVVGTGTFMLLLDITIVVVALPDMQRDLDAGFSELEWVTDAYSLALASVLLTAGTLSDRFGRRRGFVSGLVIFTAGSAACGAAVDPTMLIVSRVVQGLGGAMLFATSLALLAATFTGRDRGIAFGVWGAITGIATALGPILGGAITTGISWRGIFLVNVPIGIIAVIIALRRVDESRSSQPRRIDWPGMITFSVGLFALVYGLTEAGEKSWTSVEVLVSFGCAAVLLIAFLIIESRVGQPMLDLSLLRVPTFLGGSVAALCMNGSFFAMLLYFVLYLQNDLGYSALQAGLRMLVFSGVVMVVATIAGRIAAPATARWLIGPGLMLVGARLLAMLGFRSDGSWLHLVAGFAIAGVGSGMVNPPLASTAVGVVSVDRSGMSSGINNTFRQVGIAVGIAVYGSLFTSAVTRSLSRTVEPGAGVDTAELASAVGAGRGGEVLERLPTADRQVVGEAMQTAFASAMNTLVLVSGLVAMAGGVLTLLLIRKRDFVSM